MDEQSLVRALSLELAIAPPDRLASLFDVHHERLYRLARRLAASKDDALDLVQETFLKAARSPQSIPVGSSLEEASKKELEEAAAVIFRKYNEAPVQAESALTERFLKTERLDRIESRNDPIHLALREVAAKIAAEPDLGACEIGVAVMSLIDFVCVVELAKVFGLAILVVSCWMCVEIAHAEVWTAARLNRSGVNRPVGSRRSGMTYADAKQGNDHKQCHSVHRSPLSCEVCTR